jgi:DNA-binding MarR family transcriptional regulator
MLSVVAPPERDTVDTILEQWQAVRPDLDVSVIGVIGRVSRFSRLIDQRLEQNFADFGIEAWMFDVMATLRRSGEPFALTAGALVRQAMITTGAMTNRIDRLVARGLVERAAADDRRRVMVQLTPAGFDLVEAVVEAHLATEREILSSLSARQQRELAAMLRTSLLAFGDHPD